MLRYKPRNTFDLKTKSRAALSNPFATRHMWRVAIELWRMTLFLDTLNIGHFWTKFAFLN